MVVPFAPGGGTDVLGRGFSEVLGQQVIIENIGGAGGMVGSARVAKAAPDGYQFVLGGRADAINQTLYKAPLYNLVTDLGRAYREGRLDRRMRAYLAPTTVGGFDAP